MAIQESGFINNVNLVATNLDTITQAATLFDSSTISVLQEIATLDIQDIVDDLKKSNYLGNRKLDINLALNNLSTTTQVSYSQANLVLKDGTNIAIPFQVQLPGGSWVTEELTSHADIKNYIQNSTGFINQVTNTELTVEDAIGIQPQLIRFRDADGTSSNLDRVELIAYLGNPANSLPTYTWADTTSSLQTLANRATDILLLGQSIDSIIVLSNMPTEIQSIHTNIAALNSLYTDLTELMTVYSNLTAVLAVATGINAVTNLNVNIDALLAVNTNIVPNLAEILLADTNATSASLSQVQAAASANTSSIDASNAATSAATALGYLNQFSNIATQANTLTAGSNASASYNSTTGILTLGIPQGIKGDKGDAFTVDAFGTFAAKSTYDAQVLGFAYLAVDTSTLYFKQSGTSGDWSAGSLFGKGDTGDTGVQGFGWITGSGVPSDLSGVNGDFYLNQTNADVYNKVAGTWGSSITNLAAGINDVTTSATLTWSSSKVSTELGLKSNTTHNHTGVYEPLNANIQSHIIATTNPHVVTKTQVGLGNVDNTSNATERAATATLINKTIVAANNTITTAASGNLSSTSLNPALAELQSDIDTRVTTSSKDASGGVVGMTLFKINFKNLANTFTSQFVNSNTASRDYTFQDRTGTIADDTDLALKANKASPTFTGTVTLPTSTVAITKAPGTSSTELATTAFVAGEVDVHEAIATGAHVATAISSVPSGNLASTDVQSALNELQSDIDTRLPTASLYALSSQAEAEAGADNTKYMSSLRVKQSISSSISSNAIVTSPTGGVGYGTGSGGTVTQATSKSTAVTLNKPSGQITMNNASLAAGASVSFIVNCSNFTPSDTVTFSLIGGTTQPDSYAFRSRGTNGVFVVIVTNHGTTNSEALIVQYNIIKGATA